MLVVALLNAINLQVYAITPGSATPVAPQVRISGVAHESTSHFDLVDVWLQQLTAWGWLTMHLHNHVEYVPASWLTSPGVPASQLDAQGYLDMYQAKQFAEAEAFRTVGWTVPEMGAGALVYGVETKSPAMKSSLQVGDIITSVNGLSVSSSCQLLSRMDAVKPHQRIHLGISRVHITPSGTVTWSTSTTSMTLTTTTANYPSSTTGCLGASPPTASIGISIEDAFTFTYPATVTINTSDIGGPSAGLAMTLTLIDELTKGSLSDGHRVAVTGTIDDQGNVGDVGGVAEKTVAAAAAGDRLFIVPSVELSTALANAPSSMHIVGVTTLSQALSDLRAFGGSAWPLRALTSPH